MSLRTIFCVIFFLITFIIVRAQAMDSISVWSRFDSLEFRIDSVVHEAISNEAFPGCVIYASQSNSEVFFKSYGYHTYDSARQVQTTDIFDLASITKVMAGTMAIMKLYDDQLLHLDDRIDKYVRNIGRNIGEITIREALAHQGGLYPWIAYHQEIRKKDGSFRKKDIVNQRDDSHPYALADSIYLSGDFYEKRIKKMIKKSEVKSNPTYKYSGLFFYLIPEIVKNATGLEFDEYLKLHFYDRVGASTTGFNPLNRFPKQKIVPTEVDTFFRMKPIHGDVHDEGAAMMKGLSGNAGLFSDAEDLATIASMLLNEGRVDTLKILSPQTVNLFTTIQYPNQENRRGLGFDKPLINYDSDLSSVAKSASRQSYGHSGFTGTLFWVDPENEFVFIFLSNRVYPSRNHRALYELNVRPVIHQMLYDYISND